MTASELRAVLAEELSPAALEGILKVATEGERTDLEWVSRHFVDKLEQEIRDAGGCNDDQ
jgi:hypothetical protein